MRYFIDDLPKDKLTARSIFHACVKDPAVRMVEMVFFANIFLTKVPVMNIPWSKSRIATFFYSSLVKAYKYGQRNVDKLEIVLRILVPPN